MDYKFKNIRAMVKVVQCRDRPNNSEGPCQNSHESNNNWESYGQKENNLF